MKLTILLLVLLSFSAIAEKPQLQLSGIFRAGLDVQQYWVSEKYDGVRGYWDGTRLLTRQGNLIQAPDWFITQLPAVPLDGELWVGRGEFDTVSGIVRKQNPNDEDWQKVKYLIFDLPGSNEVFDVRLIQLAEIITKVNQDNIQLVKQFKVKDEVELMNRLDEVVNGGAEGLMLHRGNSIYKNRRTDDLLKLKKYLDAEAVVIEVLPGKGKFTGMMGALLVELPTGIRFKIGTGFRNTERETPPKPGSVITFRYFGLTSKGKPRFASFIRMKEFH